MAEIAGVLFQSVISVTGNDRLQWSTEGVSQLAALSKLLLSTPELSP